jgi:streptomycin 6-kinase
VGELVHETFRAFVARQFGAAGRAWLDALPKTLGQVASEWQLELGEELTGGVLACVVRARSSLGEDVVLKVGGPWDRPRDEIACLRRWGGRGAPRLLHADPYRGAFVLELIRPATIADDATAQEAAAVLEHLHLEPLDDLPALTDVVRRRVEQAVEQGRAKPDAAAKALASVERLQLGAPPDVLLHGDFDERNLLRCNERGLAAIDPLPTVGDPAYDAAYWAHANRRIGKRDRVEAIARAMSLDAARVRRWGAVISVHG